MLASGAGCQPGEVAKHSLLLEITRTLFEGAKETPVSCNTHAAVRVHAVVLWNGPRIVKAPISKT
jgi:hypothetical protein